MLGLVVALPLLLQLANRSRPSRVSTQELLPAPEWGRSRVRNRGLPLAVKLQDGPLCETSHDPPLTIPPN